MSRTDQLANALAAVGGAVFVAWLVAKLIRKIEEAMARWLGPSRRVYLRRAFGLVLGVLAAYFFIRFIRWSWDTPFTLFD